MNLKEKVEGPVEEIIVDEFIVKDDNETFRVLVLPKDLEPDLHWFSGIWSESPLAVYLSAEIPDSDWIRVAKSEADCHKDHEPGNLERALKRELADWVDPVARIKYLFRRYLMLRDRVDFLKKYEPGSPSLWEVQSGLKFIEGQIFEE